MRKIAVMFVISTWIVAAIFGQQQVVKGVSNVAALRQLNPFDVSRSVFVYGQNSELDGGGGMYIWNTTSVAAEDGTNIVVSAKAITGRWYKSNAFASSSAEANVASSLGAGWSLPFDKLGVSLRFNSITNDSTLTSSSNLNVITFGIAANGVGNAQLRQGTANSVIGRSSNSSGNVADIVAGSNGQVLKRTNNVLTFGPVALDTDVTGVLADGSIPGAITRDTEWNTVAKIETATGENLITSTEINSSAKLATLIGDGTGSGAAVFAVQSKQRGTLTDPIDLGSTTDIIIDPAYRCFRVTLTGNGTLTMATNSVTTDAFEQPIVIFVNDQTGSRTITRSSSGTGGTAFTGGVTSFGWGTNAPTAMTNIYTVDWNGKIFFFDQLSAQISAAQIGPGTVTDTVFGYFANVTSDVQNQINGKQSSDSDLTAIAGLSSTGFIVRTGSGTATTRSLSAGTGVSISNSDGVSGNPSISIGQAVGTSDSPTFANETLTTKLTIGTSYPLTFSYGTTVRTLDVGLGTFVSPDTSTNSTVKFTRVIQLGLGTVGGDGAENANAIHGFAAGTSANHVQTVGVLGQAYNLSTDTNPGAADATGGYFVGVNVTNTPGFGIGIYGAASRLSLTGKASAFQALVFNLANASSYTPSSFPDASVIDIGASGFDISVGIFFSNPTGAQMKVGIGFSSVAAGGKVGPVSDVDIQTDDTSATFAKINGSHGYVIDISGATLTNGFLKVSTTASVTPTTVGTSTWQINDIDGHARVRFGTFPGATNFAAAWFGDTTPSGLNYGIASDGTNLQLNAPTGNSIIAKINNTTVVTISSLGISVTPGTSGTNGFRVNDIDGGARWLLGTFPGVTNFSTLWALGNNNNPSTVNYTLASSGTSTLLNAASGGISFLVGNVGIASVASGVMIVGLDQTSGNNAGGNNAIRSANAFGTDQAGGSFIFEGGQSTGTGRGGAVIFRTTPSSTTGSTANSFSERGHYAAKSVTLTESTATTVATIAVASGKFLGGMCVVTVYADDGTDFQARTLRFNFSAVNKAGTVTAAIDTPDEAVITTAGSTLTATITSVANGNNVDLKVNAVSSLTQTTLNATVSFPALNGNGTAAVTEI